MKIFINPGHDINLDSGAVNPVHGTRECDVARDAGKMLARYLETAGCEVRTLQDDDLGLVCSESDAWGQISLYHFIVMLLTRKLEVQKPCTSLFNGQRLANDIQSQIIRSINTVDRGIKNVMTFGC